MGQTFQSIEGIQNLEKALRFVEKHAYLPQNAVVLTVPQCTAVTQCKNRAKRGLLGYFRSANQLGSTTKTIAGERRGQNRSWGERILGCTGSSGALSPRAISALSPSIWCYVPQCLVLCPQCSKIASVLRSTFGALSLRVFSALSPSNSGMSPSIAMSPSIECSIGVMSPSVLVLVRCSVP